MQAFTRSFFIPILITALVSCSKKDASGESPSPEPPMPTPQKGVLSGKITNESGKPLKGVKVYAGHHTYDNAYVIAETDNNGLYYIDLKGQPDGSWNVKGDLILTFNDIHYTFQLDPENTESFTTDEGGIRNMVWKLTGLIPGTPDDARRGGYISFYDWSQEFHEVTDIEFTLEPDGVLVDGTAGKKIVQRAAIFPTRIFDFYNDQGLRDIPVGRYKVSAVYVSTSGTRTPMYIAKKGSDNYQLITIADFRQSSFSRFQEMELNIQAEKY